MGRSGICDGRRSSTLGTEDAANPCMCLACVLHVSLDSVRDLLYYSFDAARFLNRSVGISTQRSLYLRPEYT